MTRLIYQKCISNARHAVGTEKKKSVQLFGFLMHQSCQELLSMNRSDLIKAIATRFPTLLAKDAEIAVKEILEAIGHALAQGGRIEIRGFGAFSLLHRSARISRNPKTGERVSVAEKSVPYFKAGKDMRLRIDQSAARVVNSASRSTIPAVTVLRACAPKEKPTLEGG